MTYKVPHIINGKNIAPTGRQLDIYNPATGKVIGNVGVADKSMVDNAVASAKTAFNTWSAMSAQQRAKLLFRYKALLDQNIEKIGAIVTQEHGKTLVEGIGSTQRGIDVLEYACGIPAHIKGTYAEEVASGIDCYSMHQPLGICVGITPFNFPAMIPLWMFPIAIACGNTFILKPSEKDPSCSVKLVELAKEAGIPDGVINIVHGDKETVDLLLRHGDVKAVSFVGSSTVAEYVYQTAIQHGKRAQAFGGAKNHCIVMPDADLDQAANGIVMSAYGSSGERCMAVSVVVAVGDVVADTLVKKMQPKIKALKVGAGTTANIDIGPLITREHWERVKSYINVGVQEGATLVIDGSEEKPSDAKDGFFMGGCLFDHVLPSMKIYRDEIFGPVLCVMRVPDFDAALQLLNDHDYGNGASIYTADGYTARTFAEKVQAGMVGINVPIPVPVPQHSFGGWKRSIFSDIGMYGNEAIRFNTKLKTVTQRWMARKVG
jgi:malonate-semialdehyde dehydrogenase (acetylating)/methylmalonate-semialdehyde dehydrogenase